MYETLLIVKWPLVAAVLASLPLAYYGVFLVERRTVFVAVTLAQAALCGSAVALFAHWEPHLLGLVFVAGTIGATVLGGGTGNRALPEDSRLGVLYVAMGALAVLVLSKAAHGSLDEASLLFGSLLGVTRRDSALLLGACGVLAVLCTVMHRRFLATAFDPETARVLGAPVGRYDLLFFGGLGAFLAIAINQIGVLLSFAYLVLPAANARCLFRGTRGVFVGSALVGVIGSLAGTLASVRWDLPTGAAICLALSLPLPAALLAGRKR